MPPCSCARRLRCLICLDGGAGESARRRGRCSWLAARAVDWLVHGSRHRRNPRVSSSLLGGRMRVSSCDPATRPIRPRPSYRTLNQHHLKRNRKFVDSPLEEAVSSEPVSDPKYPAGWENAWNFVGSGLNGTSKGTKKGAKSGANGPIPYASEQGIFCTLAGN